MMKSENNLWPTLRSCGHDNVTLKINECCLEIFSDLVPQCHLYVRSSVCLKCKFTQEKPAIYPNKTASFILNTDYPLELYIENAKNKTCVDSYSFGDMGRYTWNISQGFCNKIVVKERPESDLINFGVIFSVFISIFFAYNLYNCVISSKYWRFSRRDVSFQELEADLGNPDRRYQNKPDSPIRRNSRIASVDTFRGIAIAVMIFVNYGGGCYSIFRHAPWDGLTVADLVFPWFIWLMGLSIALSIRSKLRTSASKKEIFFRIVKRSLVLFLIGIVLNSGADHYVKGWNTLNSLRIPGVLQRIGLTYFAVALIELLFMKPQRNEQFGPWNLCADVVDSAVQWIITLALVATHAMVTFLLPVPGCPTGYLGPGGLHDNSKYENCTGGAAGYLDRLWLTERHMYQHPTCHKIYHTHLPYDPEGILGTLTSIFCAFLGVHAGRIILSFESTSARIKRWIIWGIVLAVIAGFLCNFQKNDGYIPINKNLWSISYVCLTASFAFIAFSILYLLIDHRRIWSGFPFLYAGMNALALYIGHELLKKFFPWYWKPFTNTHIELLSMNLFATVIWLGIAYALYRRNIFIVL